MAMTDEAARSGENSLLQMRPAAPDFCVERMGAGQLIRLAYQSANLEVIWDALMQAVEEGTATPGTAMDLSSLAQLMGKSEAGLAIQQDALDQHRLYRSGCPIRQPRLRVLAFAAALDLGGNTPVEFLIDPAEVDLYTVYLVPGLPLPDPLPLHDVAIVTIPDSSETRAALEEAGRLLAHWPRPVLNRPADIAGLDRDRLFETLDGLAGIDIPRTVRIDRERLAALRGGAEAVAVAGADFPLIVRPVGSHAGKGLERLDAASAVPAYLAGRPEAEFFLSRYVDYAGTDGAFRKYRIVFVDGRPYACHMAISEQWKIWYLNANMAQDAGKRAEEALFMSGFDEGFGRRHAGALAAIAARIGLDYFQIDCAETPAGDLLIFEADIAMVVHDMDPPEVFPYKLPQMRKVFAAFTAMLEKRARLAGP